MLPAGDDAVEAALAAALPLLPGSASVNKSVLGWTTCARGPNCVKPLGHAGWCIHSAEGARAYVASGGPVGAAARPVSPASEHPAERAARKALAPEVLQARGPPIEGRWDAASGRWVLPYAKCPLETHCVKPAGHGTFCIVSMDGAQRFLANGGWGWRL